MHSSVEIDKALPQAQRVPLADDLHLVAVTSKHGVAANFRRMVVVGEVLADLLTVSLTVTLAYAIFVSFSSARATHYPVKTVLGIASAFAIVMSLMLDRAGAYRRGNSLLRVRETEQVLRVSIEAFLIALGASFLTNLIFPRWLLVLCLVLVPLALFIEKTLMYLLIRTLHSRGYGVEKVLIYGSGHTGRRVFSVLKRSPKLGLDPVAFVDDDMAKAGNMVSELGYEHRRYAPVVEGPVERDLIARYGADLVVVAIPSLDPAKFVRTVEEAFSANARVSFVPSHLLPFDPWIDYQDVDGVLLASFGRATRRLGYEVLKRTCDLGVSLALIVLGSPLYLLLAILIKLDSSGPVVFRQDRVGQNGKLFRMYKLRTMQTSVEPYSYSPISANDHRITRIGKLLRRTSLDELPQLLNVLEGSMSLVGPRPEMPFIVKQYTESQRQRLQVKPGITGLWQLSGDRAFLIHENIEYDLYYIRHRNFFMDLAVLLHTSVFAMRGI
jgi:exopolysaccharide biosynthesis polyprenyl glycosylphosphotransferase